MTVDFVRMRGREVERIAPCGAELATGRVRRLRGIVLYRRIEAQLRHGPWSLEDWGIPLDDYDCVVERYWAPGSATYGMFIARSEEALSATFTHKRTGVKLEVTQIWADDDGEILQCGSQYGDLVY